jgi:CheY-like chemotaxis protein
MIREFKYRKKKTLLIVENEEAARKALVRIFKRRNFHVIDAGKGSDAISLLTKHNVDLFLLDIKMERPDGIDVATHAQQYSPNKPIVFVTAHAENQEYRRRISDAGINVSDWIQKPLNAQDVLNVVTKELDKSSTIEKLIDTINSVGLSTAMLLNVLEKINPFFDVMDINEIINIIEHYCGQSTNKTPLVEDKNYQKFLSEKDTLLKKYGRGYVAYFDEKFVGHNHNWDDLIEEVYRNLGRIDIFTAELLEETPIIEIITPNFISND